MYLRDMFCVHNTRCHTYAMHVFVFCRINTNIDPSFCKSSSMLDVDVSGYTNLLVIRIVVYLYVLQLE